MDRNSISALLANRLEALVRERKFYDRARLRALARLRKGLDLLPRETSCPGAEGSSAQDPSGALHHTTPSGGGS